MNKLILLLLFIFYCSYSFSQFNYPYDEIKLEKPTDYREAEPFALNASNFLLTTPFDSKNADRERALRFLSKWTAGNRDYHFELTGVIFEMIDEKDLMSLFIPAMAKFCLENKALGSNTSLIEKSAVRTVLDYSNDPKNKFTLKKKNRKRLEGN